MAKSDAFHSIVFLRVSARVNPRRERPTARVAWRCMMESKYVVDW